MGKCECGGCSAHARSRCRFEDGKRGVVLTAQFEDGKAYEMCQGCRTRRGVSLEEVRRDVAARQRADEVRAGQLELKL